MPNVFGYNRASLFQSVKENNIDRVRSVLANNRTVVNRVDKRGWTALHHAAYDGYYEICAVLLEYNADISAVTPTYDNTPLHMAAYRGHVRVVTQLIAEGADVHAED